VFLSTGVIIAFFSWNVCVKSTSRNFSPWKQCYKTNRRPVLKSISSLNMADCNKMYWSACIDRSI
jgi:hypothetical protein